MSEAQKRRRPRNPKWSEAARRMAAGEPILDVARALGVARSTLYRWTEEPAFAAAVEHERALARSEAERELGLARPAAVRALRAILDAPDAPVTVRASAASTLLQHSAPPSEAMRERARREVLAALPVDVRRVAIEHLDGTAELRALTDEQLAELLGGAS